MFGIVVLCICVLIAGIVIGPVVRRYAAETVTDIKAEYTADLARLTTERDDAETALLKFKARRDAEAAETEMDIRAQANTLIHAAQSKTDAVTAELTKLRSALEVMAGLQKATVTVTSTITAPTVVPEETPGAVVVAMPSA